ncbi:protocadherin Fat 4-like [Montipora capricornis]|uniref:protocadherin Fat 4-like n=1 Tax=Montipora capricornis TaxID=246305 RepID=UPI0035F1BC80
MKKPFYAFLVLFASLILLMRPPGSWGCCRRRTCSRQNCVLQSAWTNAGSCSRTCGYGTVLQQRGIQTYPRCGGTSCPSSWSSQRRRYVHCYNRCCPVSCSYTWNSWSSCSGCGMSTQRRTMRILRNPSCGGTSCPRTRTQTRRCNTGVCCPVNCVVNSWSSWGSCNAACERNGYQVRTRTVRTQASCRGTPCPTLREIKSCRGPCCRRDCLVSGWTSWGSCSAPTGRCSVNSGTKRRTRRVTRNPSCGGSACPPLTETSRCTPVPIPCKMSSWGSWTSCTPTNGKCGAGTQSRSRSIVTRPYCSSACPASRQTRSCTHSCCPVNCVVSSWTGWGHCSTTCGAGSKTRTRRVTVQQYCNGKSCPSLQQTTSCSQYNNRDCVMSSWSAWSLCSNGCGSGWSTRQRSIITQAVCRGKTCGTRSERRQCTDYRDNRDCVVNSWGAWGSCSEKCAVGYKQRTRTVKIPKRCRGKNCPLLLESSQCGTSNNGCEQKCSNGVCSCLPGFNLASNKKNCTGKDCKMPRPSYCAPGTSLGSKCKYANVVCPGGKTTYPVTCSLSCSKDYSIKGASTVTCQTSGQWSSYATSYCRRNNDPPTQIYLSGSASVPENQPRGTRIGSFSSMDPNSNDRHTYSIVRGGAGKFELRGANLSTLTTFDYESSPNKFTLIIRSTDNGSPPMKREQIFTISVTDVNEKPTAIQLSRNSVNENSDVDTVVGRLSTADPDKGQSYTYTLLDGAGGRFKIQGYIVKVAKSNRNCLLNGGSQCLLNFESASSHTIRVRSTDSGYPSQNVEVLFRINVNDRNDQPRGLQLSNYKVPENAPINSRIGNLSASDEDKGQRLTFSLVDDDSGRFSLDSKGTLYKAQSTDYETSKVHFIVARVMDDGNPPLAMNKNISISVVDVNEAPVSIALSSESVPENLKLGTSVSTITATDFDAVQNLTFSLDDDAAGKFAVKSKASCQTLAKGTRCVTALLVSSPINYEDTASLEVIIRVTDDKGLFRTEKFNLTVIDGNDPPTNVTLDGSMSASIPENSKNVQIDSLITDDEDFGQNFTYAIISNSGANFEIRGDKLFASSNASLDFELSSRHQITVNSTDNGSPPLSVQVSLVIELQDVNENPTGITLSNQKVEENRPTGTVIGQLNVSDPDRNQSHACILTDSANGKVAISNNQLTVGNAEINYEDASSFSVKVLCRDPGGLSVESTFVILVLDVNEAPTRITLTNDKVKENTKSGSVVALIHVIDPDNANTQVQTFSFSISSSDPNQPFAIQNDTIITKRPPDFENTAQWNVRLTAKDNGIPALSRTQTFTIQVIDTNDAPNGILLSSSFVNENSDVDTLVGSLTTLDQDGSQKHTFKLLNSASGRFKVDGNKITVAVSNKQCLKQGGPSCRLNYEMQSSNVIRVKTTDDGTPQLSFEKDLRIDLRDINDKPRDLQLSNNQVKENATTTSPFGRFSARDEDAGQSLTYSLTNDDSGRFRVDSQGRLFKAKDVDYETQNYHVISAKVLDNGNPSMGAEKYFTIEVLDVNEAPININITSAGGQLTFTNGQAQIRENSIVGTKIGTLVALDHDKNQTISFRLDDDAGGKFKLGRNTTCQTVINMPGVNTRCQVDLQSNGALDYETTQAYQVTVRGTDHKGLATTQQLIISIVDQNDPPENITLGGSHTASVFENSDGALVGQLTTADPDIVQTHAYRLLDNAAGRFVIQNDKLYVSSSANLNYEARNQFKVRIQSNDSGSPSLSVTQDFQIIVLDVNEAPVNITLAPANITENSAPGTQIGHLRISDPDNDGSRVVWQTHSCQVTGNQVGEFVIQSHVLTVGSANLDYELASAISVQVKCTDSGSPQMSLVKILDVSIDDINEAPTDISLSGDVITENQIPSLIGFFSTSDPDNTNQPRDRQSFAYSLMGNTAGLPFVINGSALNSTTSLDHESQDSWNITVKSVDSGDPPLSFFTSFQIYVVDVNEKPFNISLSNSFIDENPPQDAVVGIISSEDPDNAQSHVYSLIDGAAGRFKIDRNQLKIALPNHKCLKNGGDFCKLNYEKQQNYSVLVRATDNGNPPLSSEARLSITLKDINDRPRYFELSSNTVKENATIGSKIGRFFAVDEDAFQTLQFSLVDNDGGRFEVDSSGYLIKAKGTDYETNKAHTVVAMVRDNGTVPLELNKTFTVVVENINEAPINISLTSALGQQTFLDEQPKVDENSQAGTVVGTIEALDQDEDQNLTFSLDFDAAGKFTVDSPVTCHNLTNIPSVKTKCSTLLKVSGDLDYEASATENILARVTDNNGLFHVRSYKVTILDINDRPSNISLAGGEIGYIDENDNFGFVGELATADEDADQRHSYSLIDNGGWKFVLRRNKIYTSHSANLDYEKKSVYFIAVRTRDSGYPTLSFDKNFTIQVRDVNERPTNILLIPYSVRENSPRGTLVGKISVVDPDDKGPRGPWQNHFCNIINGANVPFSVNGATNSLVVADDINDEKGRGYYVNLQCQDDGTPALSIDKTVRIKIDNVNEKPYDITLSNNVVSENGEIVTVGVLETADPDNEQMVVQTYSYSFVGSKGNIPFVIDGHALNTTRSLDYETKMTWLLTIKSTDNNSLSTTKNFTIIVADQNDPPTGILTRGPLTVAENSLSGEFIGTVSTADQDVGQTHHYKIVDVVGQGYSGQSSSGLLSLFGVESPSGRVTVKKAGLDYEQYRNFTVTVNSTDSGFPPYTVTGSFEIRVNNINEKPQSVSLDNSKISENSPVGAVVGNLTVIDPDNLHLPLQKFNCIVVDGGPFEVVNYSTLVVCDNSLNFEKVDVYTINVTCTDLAPNPLSVSSLFILDVLDVNEAPCNLSISSQTIKENGRVGDEVGVFNVQDPDLPASGQATVSLHIIDQSPGPLAFQLVRRRLVTTRTLDFETQSLYNVTVVAADSGNPSMNTSLSFMIQVLDTNDGPTKIQLTSRQIYENATAGTVVGNLLAQDQDAHQTHSFSVILGRGFFYVNGTSLLLNNSLDYETTPVFNITVNATDSGTPPKSIQEILSINVLDCNDRPSEITLTSSLAASENALYTIEISENSPSGTSLVNMSVVDDDVGQQHTCVLPTGGDYFYVKSLSKSSSEVYVSQDADLDYERHLNAPITVSVDCRDNGNPSYSIQRNFSVRILDVNEAPFDIRLNASATVQENVKQGYVVGHLTCKDPDIGQDHVFTVLGNYSSVFQVNNNGDFLFVKDPSFLNYEHLNPFTVLSVTIQVRDVPEKHTGLPLQVTGDINITVIDVNEPPYNISLIPEMVKIPENVSIGSCIAQITSTNPESSQRVYYTLLNYRDTFDLQTKCGDNYSTFANETRGAPFLTVISSLSYDHYVIQGYEILIQAEDNGIPSESFNDTVSIHVTKLDPCQSSPCHANATCIRNDWQNVSCACTEGFTGDGFNCSDINECNNITCSYGGTCFNLWKRHFCSCPSGYHNGTDCTLINHCLSNPCQQGECTPYRNGYSCSCAPGYTGVHCETNIDDCAKEPCVDPGICVDGINKFTCECSDTSFFGTLCQRKFGDRTCEETQIPVPANVQKYDSSLCISSDAVVSLDFPEEVNISSQYWQYQFEQSVERMTYELPETVDDNESTSLEDVYIISPSLQQTTKAKRSAPKESSTVKFVVIVKLGNELSGLPVRDVLCGINNTCTTESYVEAAESFLDVTRLLCESTVQELKSKDISSCVVEVNDFALKDERHFTNMRFYYVFVGIGVILLLVTVTGLLLYRRKKLNQRKRKLIIQTSERHRPNEDETYTDTMYRHHMSKQEEQTEGAFNPLYGTTEEEVDRQVHMMDNPIYQEPKGRVTVKQTDSTTGFENPMYGTIGLLRMSEEEEEAEASGFANPMFTSSTQQKKEIDTEEPGSAVYAERKKLAKKTDTSIYDKPKKPNKPVVQEPQVVEASWFFNPLYQSSRDVMN